MNLKEAFRFQNKLGILMDEAQGILGREANITKVENTYLRQKVYDGAENETVADTPPTEFADRITDVVKFMMHLMDQREKLSKAIHDKLEFWRVLTCNSTHTSLRCGLRSSATSETSPKSTLLRWRIFPRSTSAMRCKKVKLALS